MVKIRNLYSIMCTRDSIQIYNINITLNMFLLMENLVGPEQVQLNTAHYFILFKLVVKGDPP